MRLFRRKNAPLLGIDISSTAVKLLELSKSNGRYKVESYAITLLPQETVVESNIADTGVIANAIKAAVKQSGTKINDACVGISDSVVVTKLISVPAKLSNEDLEEQVLIEADQHVPNPLDEVNLDFEVQGVTENKPELIDVLWVATRKKNIDDRVEVLSATGLKAKIVDVETFAMENSFALLASHLPDGIEGQTIAVVDIGATTTTLNVLYGGVTIYTREQTFGGRQLTEEIQRQYNLSYEEADLSKRLGDLPDNYLPDILKPFKKAMLQQVDRLLRFFLSSSANSANKNIDSIVLAGGCASIQGLDLLVEENLEVPAIVANPFRDMMLSKRVKPQNLIDDAPAMMISCGLALRSFD